MSRCPHCNSSNDPVEVAGKVLHTFPDRWISCSGKEQAPAKVRAFTRGILWLQFAFPLHYVHHLVHLFRSRF
jgi:hypothetical protein